MDDANTITLLKVFVTVAGEMLAELQECTEDREA